MIEPIVKPSPVLNLTNPEIRRLGQVKKEAVAIFIQDQVLENILDYSDEDLQREIGGFLIGNYYLDTTGNEELRYVQVDHFLPAVDAKSHSASLTFTHDTWAKANHEVHTRFPEDRIVGWHHTHPRMGVFFSAYDHFIHENFFSCDWQIAMVVDPARQELGFYQWQNLGLENCGFVCIPAQD